MTPSTELLGFVALGLLALAVATVIYQFALTPADLQPDVGQKGLKRKAVLEEEGLFNTIEPLMRWLARRIAGLPLDETRDRINTQLRQSGEYLGLTADEYLALCVLSALGMLVSGLVIDKLSNIGGIVVLMFVGFGSILPHMQVSGEIERRFKQVNRGLPGAIDLVALTMSAGLDFPGALRQVTEKTADKSDALYEELTRILQELELGRTRKQALLSFAERSPTESVRDFVSAVVQAEEKGNPLAEVLQIQATMLRMRRSIAAEESAARAGVLMMGPLLLIFCTIMMIILGPFAVNIAAGQGNLKGSAAMATPQLDVYLPDGSVQSYPLTEERVVVGTASRCLVVIDRPEVAPEHLLLSARPDGCWVAVARGVTTPTLLDGEPFERGVVAWGRALTIGPVRLGLNDGTKVIKKTGKDGEKKEEKVSPVLLIAAAIIIPFALYSSFSNSNNAPPARIGTQAPALFDDPLVRPCTATDPTLNRQSAEESTRVALSKAERMPFRMQDGVESVLYYTQAASCYTAAGDAASADQASRRAASIKNRLEDEYRAHRFRLERALEQSRTEDALFEVRMIKAMVSHRRGPYQDALVALERQLTLRLDQAQAAQR